MEQIIHEIPLEYKHKNHKLSQKHLENWECHIEGRKSDWILVYKIYPEKQLVVFTRTGSHSDIFE